MQTNRPRKPLRLVSYEEMMSVPVAPVPWLVEPLIAVGDRAIVYGEWGTYKSWVLLSLALHLAAGRPWLGKFPVSEPKRVLYVDEEMSRRLFTRRLQRLAAGMGLKASDKLPIRLLSRHGLRADEQEIRDLLRELKEIEDFDPDVVIIDTFRRVFRGDEISAKDVAEFWRAWTPVVDAGKTLILSHHMRKAGLNGRGPIRDRFSGSTDILAGTDSALACAVTPRRATRFA